MLIAIGQAPLLLFVQSRCYEYFHYHTQSVMKNWEKKTIAHNTQIYTLQKFHLTFDILLSGFYFCYVHSALDCAHLCTALLYMSFHLGKQTLWV